MILVLKFKISLKCIKSNPTEHRFKFLNVFSDLTLTHPSHRRGPHVVVVTRHVLEQEMLLFLIHSKTLLLS